MANGSWIVIIMDASPSNPLQSTTVQQPPIDPQTPDLSSHAGWALNLPRSISGTVPYGGMSDGQMVMGSAMGGGGAQFGGGGFGCFGDFGGSSFGQPQPYRLDFGSQPAAEPASASPSSLAPRTSAAVSSDSRRASASALLH